MTSHVQHSGHSFPMARTCGHHPITGRSSIGRLSNLGCPNLPYRKIKNYVGSDPAYISGYVGMSTAQFLMVHYGSLRLTTA